MYCPDCGKANPVGQKFCRSCGLSLKPVSQALAGEVVPAEESFNSGALSTVTLQGEQKFWQNPLIYALLLIILGMIIGVIGDKVVLTKMVTDMGTLITVLGVGLLGFKGVMLVIAPPRSLPKARQVPQIEETSKLTPPLLSAEPPSVTENTTRQLDANVERGKEKSRDTQPTS